jgi:hypothetical protein
MRSSKRVTSEAEARLGELVGCVFVCLFVCLFVCFGGGGGVVLLWLVLVWICLGVVKVGTGGERGGRGGRGGCAYAYIRHAAVYPIITQRPHNTHNNHNDRRTKGFSGAEIEGVVKAAASKALERALLRTGEGVVGWGDFEEALGEVCAISFS